MATTKAATRAATRFKKRTTVQARKPRRSARLAFRVGDPIVVPPHGVGRVQGIVMQKWDGKSHRFYKISMPGPPPWEGTLRLDRLEANRVRPVVSRHRVREVLRILRSSPDRLPADSWRQRKLEGKEALDRGDIIETARLVRDIRKRGQDVGRAEAQDVELAKLATTILVQELAAAEGVGEEEMTLRVERALTGE